jgi:hypothetical protein
MATIQIRGIPEDAYEVIRRRARADNRSIQSYMLEHMLDFTSRPTKGEVFAEWDRRTRERGPLSFDSADIVSDIRGGHDERDQAMTRFHND